MQTTQPAPDTASALLARAPRKIVCLETYWGDYKGQLFQSTSVRPFLEALATHFNPPLRIAHRFVESSAQLAHYTGFPDGLLWHDPEVFDTPFYYLSFHGSPATLRGTLERMNAETLCAAFAGWGGQFPNLVHFGACSVFAGREGRDFARDFLARSGCRGITGYTTEIDWIDSMVIDLLFIRRFFADADPWTNLKRIHESVLGDFAPARQLGFVLYTPTRSRGLQPRNRKAAA
jgi:hypothetical protein